MAQVNPIVGNFIYNTKKILDFSEKAKQLDARVIIFPELVVTGYPPEDLLLKPRFIEKNQDAIQKLCSELPKDISVILGFVHTDSFGKRYNAAGVIEDRKVQAVYHKRALPNYSVFDEKRYFEMGKDVLIYSKENWQIGITICEDVWQESRVIDAVFEQGANLLINISASPFYINKFAERLTRMQDIAVSSGCPVFYTNLVGGQDELIFDGQSFAVDGRGQLLAQAKRFQEDLVIVDVQKQHQTKPVTNKINYRSFTTIEQPYPPGEVYEALVCGLKDYVVKNNFKEVILGLSGGIDSALVAAIACDALGKEKVHSIFMPSRFSSKESLDDAEAVAKNLGMSFKIISIEPLFEKYLAILTPFFKGKARDLTEENIQARIRGNILMAMSNKFGYLVLITGNKSEMSVGYCTLYGDMAGGLAVIKDISKTLVYQLCRWRNQKNQVIPERIFTKEPTAELRENQKDSDSIPPYDVLDPILKAYVEEGATLDDLLKRGLDKTIVEKIVRLVDLNEYKRRQGPPGLKVTRLAFGKDWRFPITNHFSKNFEK